MIHVIQARLLQELDVFLLAVLNPNVAKAGGIQSQGAKGATVTRYCNPLETPDLDSSGFSFRVKK